MVNCLFCTPWENRGWMIVSPMVVPSFPAEAADLEIFAVVNCSSAHLSPWTRQVAAERLSCSTIWDQEKSNNGFMNPSFSLFYRWPCQWLHFLVPIHYARKMLFHRMASNDKSPVVFLRRFASLVPKTVQALFDKLFELKFLISYLVQSFVLWWMYFRVPFFWWCSQYAAFAYQRWYGWDHRWLVWVKFRHPYSEKLFAQGWVLDSLSSPCCWIFVDPLIMKYISVYDSSFSLSRSSVWASSSLMHFVSLHDLLFLSIQSVL